MNEVRPVTEIPVVKASRASYENLVADCPWCGAENVFNRASDLGTFEPIGGQDLSCQRPDCGKAFRVVGDSVNNAHEMLVFDCYELLARKHYVACVLNLALAYEVFFNLFFRVELLYKPFASDPDHDLTTLNRLSDLLREKIQGCTFASMRSLFLQHMVAGRSPHDWFEADSIIAGLPDHLGDPRDSTIEAFPDPTLAQWLIALKRTPINVLRNRVVHKQAYRPHREEVEAAIEETRSIFFPLTAKLDLHDEIHWYMGKT